MVNISRHTPVVSIIIPCYNQAQFLGEAIESALAQTYPACELLIIDDGSTDNTLEVANAYSTVKYIQQQNRGLASARNTGIRYSQGDYLLFLDADDRLLPDAVEEGIKSISEHPECAFAFGRHSIVDLQGRPIKAVPITQEPDKEIGPYAWLLQGNHIGMHATVLYRRSVFDELGVFNNQLPACEDYELYLRITRKFPIVYHDHLIAEYRKHQENMSKDIPMMLRAVLNVLDFQLPYVRGNHLNEKMYGRGIRNWSSFYSRQLVVEVHRLLRANNWNRALEMIARFIQYFIQRTGRSMKKHIFKDNMWLRSGSKKLIRFLVGPVDFGDLRHVTPAKCGKERGDKREIHGYYTETFLDRYRSDIQGKVLEIACGSSTSSSNKKIISFEQLQIENEQFLPDSYDCILMPQIHGSVYDLRQSLTICYRILKQGGVLLAVLAGMPAQDSSSDGHWFYTQHSARRIFAEIFPEGDLEVQTYGNVFAAASLLHCIPADEMQANELAFCDPHYPIIISVRAVKSVDRLPTDVK